MKMSCSVMKHRWNLEGEMEWGKMIGYSLLGILFSSLLFTVCLLAYQAVEPSLQPLLHKLWQAASLPPEKTAELVMTLFNILCHFLAFSYIVYRADKKVKGAPFKVSLVACLATWLIPWLYYVGELLQGASTSFGVIELVEMVLYLVNVFLAMYLPYERFIKEAPPMGPEMSKAG